MGSTTLASPFVSLTSQVTSENIAPYGMGSPATKLKYSGAFFDLSLGALGDPQNNAFAGCPADAVALECWVNASAADDYLFFAPLSGLLSSAGVLATNIAANLLNRRYVTAGAHMVIPLAAVGTVPSGFRFAGGKTTSRLQARFVSSSANTRYLWSAAASAINMTGVDSTQQLPYLTASQFPDLANQAACELMVAGTGGLFARFTVDGTAPSATTGDIVPVGSRLFIDQADHGISWSALKIWLPTGVNLHGTTYKYL